jgi:hypothetical protein
MSAVFLTYSVVPAAVEVEFTLLIRSPRELKPRHAGVSSHKYARADLSVCQALKMVVPGAAALPHTAHPTSVVRLGRVGSVHARSSQSPEPKLRLNALQRATVAHDASHDVILEPSPFDNHGQSGPTAALFTLPGISDHCGGAGDESASTLGKAVNSDKSEFGGRGGWGL